MQPNRANGLPQGERWHSEKQKAPLGTGLSLFRVSERHPGVSNGPILIRFAVRSKPALHHRSTCATRSMPMSFVIVALAESIRQEAGSCKSPAQPE